MIKAFNKKIKPRVYQAGDLVIKYIILPQGDPKGKWTPTYEGTFVVKKMFLGGVMILTTMDGCCTPIFPPKIPSSYHVDSLTTRSH